MSRVWPPAGGLNTGDAATIGDGSGSSGASIICSGDGADAVTDVVTPAPVGGLNTGEGAAAFVLAAIFVAVGVNLVFTVAALVATGEGAKGNGPSCGEDPADLDSMLRVRWSADPGGTAVRTGLRLAIFVMSLSGDATRGGVRASTAAGHAGASPPRSMRSPPTSHPSSVAIVAAADSVVPACTSTMSLRGVRIEPLGSVRLTRGESRARRGRRYVRETCAVCVGGARVRCVFVPPVFQATSSSRRSSSGPPASKNRSSLLPQPIV